MKNENDEQEEKKENHEGKKQNHEEINSESPKSYRKQIIGLIIAIVILIVAVLGTGYGYFWSKMSKMNQTELGTEEIQKNELGKEQESAMGAYTNIAIFGVDNRSNGNYKSGNSDTIMIASMNNQTYEVKLVSVYRDTYLKVNDAYYGKANAAYAFGGAAEALSMLNSNFDLDLTKYVAVDWYALVDAINLLGGIEIEITEEERQKINEYIPEVEQVTGIETSSVQETGKVTLDGVQATAYVRIRKLAGNDYKRTQRQRIVIAAMLNKVKQSDLATLNTMLDRIFPMVETNLKLKDIISMAMNVTRYELVSTTGFPFEKGEISLSGIGDCVVPITLEKNVSMLHEYLFGEEIGQLSEKVGQISQEIISRTGLDIGNEVDTESYTTGNEVEEDV